MSAKIIDGNKIAETIKNELSAEIEKLKAENNVTPGLAVVLVGENPASKVYVRNKNRTAHAIGIYSEQHDLPAETSESDLLALIDKLNSDDKINGILVQLPLPDHIDENKVINSIHPDKDVDGFHPINLGKLMIGKPGFLPCTPYGIQKMLVYADVDIEGANVVVLGRSNIVGKPIANILVQKLPEANATVTICHSRTKNLAEVAAGADILIAAIGRAEFVTADMVNENTVVIDVGINRVDDPSAKRGYRLVGDVKFDEVSAKCRAISPVPGGVGPMTITMLLYNTVQSAKKASGLA
jgi:methylenetetrahydrofolate dehydrogenase (NADP+)/methenyltetrahydrofolate cyclohydrolase